LFETSGCVALSKVWIAKQLDQDLRFVLHLLNEIFAVDMNSVLHTEVKSAFTFAVLTADTKLTCQITTYDNLQYISGSSVQVQLVFVARLCANPNLPLPTVKTAEREQQFV